MTGQFFSRFGWTRDDAKWGRLQFLSLATLIASGTVDLQYWAHYLAIPLSVTAQHWITVIAAVVLWVAGKNDTSDLPGKTTSGSIAPRTFPPAAAAIFLALALGAGAVTSTSCAKTPPNLSPAGKTAFTADQIVQRLDELQNAVIASNHLTPGSVPDAVAIPLVRFCVESAKVLKASPTGVLPALAAEWRSVKGQIPAQYRQLPAVVGAFVAVDVAFAEFGQ